MLITLFTWSHCYMFQPSRGHPQGVLITFHEQGQQTACPNVNTWKSKHIYKLVILTVKYKIVTSVHEYEQFNFNL
jgi:hypothetical protein